MKTLMKAALGAALLVTGAVATTAPANAQSFGFSFGAPGFGAYYGAPTCWDPYYGGYYYCGARYARPYYYAPYRGYRPAFRGRVGGRVRRR